MMRRELLHIWGPFSIYSYGLAIALGLVAFIWLFLRDPKRPKIISQDKFLETVCLSLIVGLCGARLLFIINSLSYFETWTDVFAVWSGGLSMLGGIIALLIFLPWYLKKINVHVLPFLDLAALYAPVIHCISRFGCFMAGCCYGKASHVPWAITYTDINSEAPLHVPLHPTQLYMALALFLTFLLFYFYVRYKVHYSGQLLMLYLMVESSLRFSIDFVRADLEYFSFDTYHILSAHQWIALAMFCASAAGYVMVSYKKTPQTNPI